MATGTGNLPNPTMSFSPFAILTAEEMNDLVENIESLADGTGIGDGSVSYSDINWPTIISPYDVYAYRSSALTTTASAITKLVYNSEVYDVGSNYDTTTAEFTAPVNGYYNVLAALETTSSSNTYIMLVYVNGVQVTRGPSTVSPSAITSVLMTDRLRLAAGDKLDIRYFILNALTVVTTQSETYLKVSLDKRY